MQKKTFKTGESKSEAREEKKKHKYNPPTRLGRLSFIRTPNKMQSFPNVSRKRKKNNLNIIGIEQW